jgi:hypothetical protein
MAEYPLASHEAVFTGLREEYSQPPERNLTLFLNHALVDLECLSSVERIGDPPDGCDPQRYRRLGWIDKREGFWLLTQHGKQQLADLRSMNLSGQDALASRPSSHAGGRPGA